MRRELEAWIPGPVVTKGNSKKAIVDRGGRARVVPGKAARKAEPALTRTARLISPAERLEGEVELEVLVVRPIPKRVEGGAARRARMVAGLERPKTSATGDRGNYLKMIEDVLEAAGFFKDDAQVVCGNVEKCWGPVGGWFVRARELGEEDLRLRADLWGLPIEWTDPGIADRTSVGERDVALDDEA